MPRFIPMCLAALLASAGLAAEPSAKASAPSGKVSVVIIPVREEINAPALYILRRGLKDAITQNATVVVLDMKTPGGSAQTAFDMMEALGKFPGQTITFVNPEAMSAGAFIAASTGEIWFTPDGVIGAAAAVTENGEDIPETMRLKLNSYLRAKMRALSEGKGYRGEVISAMIDKDYELKIGDKVLKGKGELLSLTASEASKTYGDPAQPLLAAGIAKDVNDLLAKKFGAQGFEVRHLEVNWSEELAALLTRLSPIFLGLGLLGLFLEFKLPSHGLFAAAGVALLAVVFLSSYVAGLSGHEPMLVFAVGLVLVALEVFLFPGVVVVAMTGVVLIFGSLLWSMADLWPNEPLTLSGDVFVGPALNMLGGIAIAVVLALALARFIPKGWFFSRLAVTTPSSGSAQVAGVSPKLGSAAAQLLGVPGRTVTGLYPSGQVEIAGQRYEARLEVGSAAAGTPVVVRKVTDFGLVVEVAS